LRPPSSDRARGTRLPARACAADPRTAGGRRGAVTPASAASVECVLRSLPTDSAPAVTPASTGLLDEESRAWLQDLHAQGPTYLAAVGRLHELLLRAARFEVARRRPG